MPKPSQKNAGNGVADKPCCAFCETRDWDYIDFNLAISDSETTEGGRPTPGGLKVLVLEDTGTTGPVSNVIATVNGDGQAWGCPSYAFEELESLAPLICRDFLAFFPE